MHMLKTGIALAALLALGSLGGCATLDAMNAQAEAQQRASDQATCEGYGYQPGTNRFADCMMATAHHRDVQNSIAQQQAAWQKQQQADAWEREKAKYSAQGAQQQRDIDKLMRSGGSLTPSLPPVSTGSNCTSTTTATQTGNAGTSTTNTVCH